MMDFYNKHPELRDKFAMLAFHESHTVKTFKELDEKNAENEKFWKGKLPFPVLIDRDGRTVARYGVFAYPTVVLIDPDGKIVPGGSLALLKEKLGVKD